MMIIMQLGFMAGVVVIMGAMLFGAVLMVVGAKIIDMIRPVAMAMGAGAVFV